MHDACNAMTWGLVFLVPCTEIYDPVPGPGLIARIVNQQLRVPKPRLAARDGTASSGSLPMVIADRRSTAMTPATADANPQGNQCTRSA